MIYDMYKPSKNMLLSQRELDQMYYEQQQEYIKKDDKSDEILKEQGDMRRAINEYNSYLRDYQNEKNIDTNKRVAFLQKVKESFITECMMKIYTESLSGMDKRDKQIARNLIIRFVQENGAGDLIRNFRTKNILLSEVSRICQKYYDKVLESCDKKEQCEGTNECNQVKEYNLDTTIKDDFFTELEDLDTTDAASTIKSRVGEALETFIQNNSAQQLEYKSVLDDAKESIADAKNEAYVDEITYEAKRKINELRRDKPKNIFNVMVESLTTKALTDNSYKKQYVNESKVNMDKIVEDTTLIYTMLEMVNTVEMIDVNEQFITNYLNNLNK